MSLTLSENRWKINNKTLLGLSLFFALLRFGGDAVFSFLNQDNSLIIMLWKMITGFAIFIPAVIFIFSINIFNTKAFSINSSDYTKYSLNLLLLISGLMLFSVIAPVNPNNDNNIFELFVIENLSASAILVGAIIILFIHKMLILNRNKRTSLYIKLLAFFMFYFALAEFASIALQFERSTLDWLHLIILMGAMSIFFLSINRNSWIAVLPKNQKWKLLGLSFLTIVFSVVFIVVILDDDSKLERSLNFYMPGSAAFLGMSMIYLGLYNFRLFFAALLSLPTTGIMEKKTTELSSLTYLNRLVAETVDFNKIVDTVTTLAMNASGASGAWIELYENEATNIKSCRNINKNAIEHAHGLNNLAYDFIAFNAPTYIDSVKKSSLRNRLPKNDIRSLLLVPVFSSESRIGSLIVFSDEEYGFDYNEVQALSAFSDNLSISLENARLLEKSIENEKYKKELLIAKDIQKKLLPGKLPEIEGFDISSISLFAEEVGGDYYDCVQLMSGDYCLIIADVSGKGMSAAFYMAQLKGAVLSMSKVSSSGAELLKKINNAFYGSMEKKIYITIETVTIKPNNPIIKICRAGHLPAMVNISGDIKYLQPKGIGVGLASSVIFDSVIEEIEVELTIGNSLLLITDGLSELKKDEAAELGLDSLAVLLEDAHSNSGIIIKQIQELIQSLAVDAFDDITAIAVHYNGKNIKGIANVIEIEEKSYN